MMFVALASDYDGTLAEDGTVDRATFGALERLKAFGKRLILVTGRELPSLLETFGELNLFDIIVAENGAVIFIPSTGEERLISSAPPANFVDMLRARGVAPLSVGRGIVATWTPNEKAVIDTIRDLGLDWQVTFNKGAVMCLAPGVNKASGLAAALDGMHLSPVNVVGAGDAENDLAFLAVCGCSVAVANALDTVKANVDIVTSAARGAGVSEFIDLWRTDADRTFAGIHRHDLPVGDAVLDGAPVNLPSNAGAVLVAGSSGAGKSKLVTLLLERITDRGYQTCVVDPEGDYATLNYLAHVGDSQRTPSPEEVVGLLHSSMSSISLNLLGTDISDRPVYFEGFLSQLSKLRASTGRPHWIILDEAHHLIPNTVESHYSAADLSSSIIVTTRPSSLSAAALAAVRTVVGVGDNAQQLVAEFCETVGEAAPPFGQIPNDVQVIIWERDSMLASRLVAMEKPRQEHLRHTRKYAEGRLGEDKSFYFNGPANLLNLRAHNLAMFLQLAQGVDDETWLFHLRRGDYTRWFRDSIKDSDLADEVESLESSEDPVESRQGLSASVKRRYAAADLD
jgi:hydroxymethylpyrimidine pyrophosphatase-like HAD family hydrolase